jgi:AGZA family xanthine/uracil permease-like MFS transporter
VPAVVTAIATSFTFSIATGIGVGFVVYAAMELLAGPAGGTFAAGWRSDPGTAAEDRPCRNMCTR